MATFLKRSAIAVPAVMVAVASLIALGWAGYALTTWAGYGRLGVDRRSDPLLDRFMPVYEVGERHETRVDAPADVTYAAARAFDLGQSPVVRAIFRGREILMRAPHENGLPTGLVDQTLSIGWRILAEEPGRELVVGAVTQPWEPHVTFHGVKPERFAAFDAPGYAQIAWTIEVEPLDERTSVFRTVTRVRTTDPESREKFRRYWSIYSPGIRLIRTEILRAVRAEAERR